MNHEAIIAEFPSSQGGDKGEVEEKFRQSETPRNRGRCESRSFAGREGAGVRPGTWRRAQVPLQSGAE
jgi:hypothetical protein